MKLIYCYNCDDIFKLDFELRQCKCGTCKGRYDSNGHTAVTNGAGISIGLNNMTLIQALAHIEDCPEVECWVRPNAGKKNKNCRVDEKL